MSRAYIAGRYGMSYAAALARLNTLKGRGYVCELEFAEDVWVLTDAGKKYVDSWPE